MLLKIILDGNIKNNKIDALKFLKQKANELKSNLSYKILHSTYIGHEDKF